MLAIRGGRGWRAVRRDEGQELVEFAIIMPILLTVVFGIIEFGRAYDIDQSITALGREAANIAARGTPIDTVLAVTMINGSGIALNERGGAVISRVTVEDRGPVVMEQVASPSFVGRSRLGTVGSPVPALDREGQREGAAFYVVEIFYGYEAVTPLAKLVGRVVPDTIYDRAIF